MKSKTDRKTWSVYVLRCANGALYAGTTNRLAGRIADHNSGRGARYTAAFGPVELVWHKRAASRSAALKFEARIKRMTRRDKEALVGRGGASAVPCGAAVTAADLPE